MNVLEAEQMIEAGEKMQKQIFVVKQNRYNPPVQQVKKLIENHALGKIFFVNINCFWNRNDDYYNSEWRGKISKDGGCLYTQFSHFVDILYYLVGDCKAVFSAMKNTHHPTIEIEDNGTCTAIAKEGALVNINFSTCSYNKNMEGAITIIAEHGTVKIGGQYLNTIEYQNIKELTLPEINITAKANDYGSYQGSMSNHDEVYENVVATLQGKATAMTNAQEGKAVVKMIQQFYEVQQ
jgi:UDP-N-acetyl-2-amino-2-deoxyglucuronate dehydrogenase